MAISAEKSPSHLSIVYNNGVDDNGKTKKKTKSYAGVKAEATNENLYAVATAIIGLQSNTPIEVLRKDESQLSEA
ncbi:DUF1659 domain-containing protein [Lutibacter sp. B2]|nr:DUF1659 domain-containing protein [Lutibacter sp. B2]